jgi:hypothetical protein
MDPRVKASPAELQQQFDLEMKLASAVSQSSEAVTQARTVHEQIAKLLDQASGSLKDSLQNLDHQVTELLNGQKEKATGTDANKAPTLPGTGANLIALYGDIGKADAAPTAAQVEAVNKNEAALNTMLTRWNQLKTRDIPALNRELKAAGLTELRLDLPPQQQEGGEDEE